MFSRECNAQGFHIASHYQPKQKSIRFRCSCSDTHNDTKGKGQGNQPKKKSRISRTSRPIRGEDFTCKFSFRVYWDAEQNRWFLPYKQAGSIVHSGHIREDPQHMRILAKDMPQNELQLANDSLQSHIPATATGSLLSHRTGLNLEWYQLKILPAIIFRFSLGAAT